MTDIEDSSIPGIFWGKHPAGGNWLFYLRLVEGRTLPPIPKATREALKTKALERRANVVICQVRLGAGGEVLRVTSKNLDR